MYMDVNVGPNIKCMFTCVVSWVLLITVLNEEVHLGQSLVQTQTMKTTERWLISDGTIILIGFWNGVYIWNCCYYLNSCPVGISLILWTSCSNKRVTPELPQIIQRFTCYSLSQKCACGVCACVHAWRLSAFKQWSKETFTCPWSILVSHPHSWCNGPHSTRNDTWWSDL